MEKGETFKMPKLFHHLWHDRVNMEFAEACMRAMLWHRGMGGKFDPYLDSDEYKLMQIGRLRLTSNTIP
jgi:hypothetical protein